MGIQQTSQSGAVLGESLAAYLQRWTGDDATRADTRDTVVALGEAGVAIAKLTRRGALAGDMAGMTGQVGGGDDQKKLDLVTNEIIIDAMKSAPVAAVASEELPTPHELEYGKPLLVAVDPLDGSSNIDTNVGVGTIFAVLPALKGVVGSGSFLQPGHRQTAAGFIVYGPQTTFLLTVGDGAHVFTYDDAQQAFIATTANVKIAPATQEYAINGSNYRHWDEAIRVYVDDCVRGTQGPRAVDFNTRWIGSFVCEVSRIFSRGGVYLYPGDKRPGYMQGRLRLIYEVNPAAFLIEQAGGMATTGLERVLDLLPSKLHQHAPLIAGSYDEVDYVRRMYAQPDAHGERSPLFNHRGLFHF